MKTDAPKNIWVVRDRHVLLVEPENVCERIVPYIRADIVEDLVEALEEMMYSNTDKAERMALAALKALEEE